MRKRAQNLPRATVPVLVPFGHLMSVLACSHRLKTLGELLRQVNFLINQSGIYLPYGSFCFTDSRRVLSSAGSATSLLR